MRFAQSTAPRAISPPPCANSLPLESGLEQAELPLDRIAAVESGRARMHRRIEPAHGGLQRLGALDQRAQALRQQLDILLVAMLAGRRA